MKNISECIDFILDNPDSNHCLGVFSFLHLGNAPNFLCLAGLFHSIYYHNYTREQIINYIGKEAEELVFLFCLFDDERILKSKNEDLIYLGYANILEYYEQNKCDYKLILLKKKYEKAINAQ